MTKLKSIDYVFLAMILTAFAANSVLNRLALKTATLGSQAAIDPASFTIIRLVSGAVILVLLLFLSGKKISKPTSLHWRGAVFLFIYAIAFSYAYISLDAAMGALVLFGVVQVCILAIAVYRGRKLKWLEWCGCLLAVIGLLVLTVPQILQTQSSSQIGFLSSYPFAIFLMIIAGVAWGLFTVNGAGSQDAMFDTATCFVLSVPMVLITGVIVIALQSVFLSFYGVFLALLSGVVASGIGYAMWYGILPKLKPSQAASSQLLVPIIAAAGGFVFLGETLSLNFILAATLTLGGVLIVVKAANS